MKITNRYGLPKALVRAVEADPYSKGGADFSITELLSPPRASVLKKLHDAEIEMDVTDLTFILLGQGVHAVLERANATLGEGVIFEKRFFTEIEGFKVSGQIDVLEDGVLSDFKVSGQYPFRQGSEPKEEHIAQLNMQLELLRRNGLDATELQIVGIIRDFSETDQMANLRIYPQASMVRIPIPMWPREKSVAFMRERVLLHAQAKVTLPACTDEERWAREGGWALMKKGQKKAIKIYRGENAEADARAHAASDPKILAVEPRYGQNMRCERYCAAAKFCSQFLWLQEQSRTKAQSSQKEDVA